MEEISSFISMMFIQKQGKTPEVRNVQVYKIQWQKKRAGWILKAVIWEGQDKKVRLQGILLGIYSEGFSDYPR